MKKMLRISWKKEEAAHTLIFLDIFNMEFPSFEELTPKTYKNHAEIPDKYFNQFFGCVSNQNVVEIHNMGTLIFSILRDLAKNLFFLGGGGHSGIFLSNLCIN